MKPHTVSLNYNHIILKPITPECRGTLQRAATDRKIPSGDGTDHKGKAAKTSSGGGVTPPTNTQLCIREYAIRLYLVKQESY